jgi:hypothetical protein
MLDTWRVLELEQPGRLSQRMELLCMGQGAAGKIKFNPRPRWVGGVVKPKFAD